MLSINVVTTHRNLRILIKIAISVPLGSVAMRDHLMASPCSGSQTWHHLTAEGPLLGPMGWSVFPRVLPSRFPLRGAPRFGSRDQADMRLQEVRRVGYHTDISPKAWDITRGLCPTRITRTSHQSNRCGGLSTGQTGGDSSTMVRFFFFDPYYLVLGNGECVMHFHQHFPFFVFQ